MSNASSGVGSVVDGGRPELAVRPMEGAKDVDRVLELRREFCASERLPWDEAVTRRALLELSGDPAAGRVWLVEADAGPVGYAVLTRGFSLEFEGRDAFLDELYVRPAFRGRGLGRALVDAVEGGCRELGVRALHLEVDRDQTRVQELYRRAGFRDHDRYLMTKWIEAR